MRPHEIVKRIKETASTVILSTDTFLSQYARVAEKGELKSLRILVSGAERVRDETRRLLQKKHALEPLEGYGLTETSPFAAANQPGDSRAGNCRPSAAGDAGPAGAGGRNPQCGPPVPERAECHAGLYQAGEARRDPVPVEGGWHDTGDVVSIDEDGYITIKGR